MVGNAVSVFTVASFLEMQNNIKPSLKFFYVASSFD